MALSITGATGAATSGAATSLTYSVTTAAGDDLLTVGCGLDTVTGITFNGSALTQKVLENTVFTSALYYKVNPSITTANVVVSQSSTWEISSGAIRFSGTNTGNPFGITNHAQSNSTTLAGTTSGNIVIDVLRNADQTSIMTVGGSQTQQWKNATTAGTGRNISGGSSQPAGGSITMTWTLSISDNPAICAMEVNAATGTTVNTLPSLSLMGVGM